MALGERIREARLYKNMTQKDLASLIGAKHNSISNWEKNQNRPDPDMIENICGVLDVSPSFLLNGEKSSELSPREKKLVEEYRTLPLEDKDIIDNMVNSLSKRVTTYSNKFTELMAAHNDKATDTNEQRLINKDIERLKNM